jgi:hypothetical protein
MVGMEQGETGGLEELDVVDLNDCPVCVARGDVCEFHRGWAAGWDDATSVMAAAVDGDAVELVERYRDDASVVA